MIVPGTSFGEMLPYLTMGPFVSEHECRDKATVIACICGDGKPHGSGPEQRSGLIEVNGSLAFDFSGARMSPYDPLWTDTILKYLE